jgi:hypothetical protein
MQQRNLFLYIADGDRTRGEICMLMVFIHATQSSFRTEGFCFAFDSSLTMFFFDIALALFGTGGGCLLAGYSKGEFIGL